MSVWPSSCFREEICGDFNSLLFCKGGPDSCVYRRTTVLLGLLRLAPVPRPRKRSVIWEKLHLLASCGCMPEFDMECKMSAWHTRVFTIVNFLSSCSSAIDVHLGLAAIPSLPPSLPLRGKLSCVTWCELH